VGSSPWLQKVCCMFLDSCPSCDLNSAAESLATIEAVQAESIAEDSGGICV